ncbi:MAG: hypothetical protein R3330_06645, partial [Saprospiraceae bacterium]|nr:hypothetical protein [Saprospiraceae bacterium]
MKQRPDWRHVLVALLFLAAILATAVLPRTDWPMILGTYGLSFGLYLLILGNRPLRAVRLRYWIMVALLARVLLLFCFPNLSDDIYRFIWDADLSLRGINPYQVIPSKIIPEDSALRLHGIYPALNSPDYHTIYPPLGQGLFALASWIGGLDWFTFALVLKLFYLAVECLTLRLMYLVLKRAGATQTLLVYALNPLVLVELMGNVHLEVLVVLGLVLIIYSLQRNKLSGVVGGFALGIGAKLIPLMLIPLLIRRLSPRRFVMFLLLLTGISAVIFLPMLISDPLQEAGSSLDLYFRKFEFNASFYYIARWIGFQLEGYNLIATTGPLLAGLTVLIVGLLVTLERAPATGNFSRTALFALTTYLLLATTVHPWYLCPLVALSVFTPYRYPVVWSAMAFLSYAA